MTLVSQPPPVGHPGLAVALSQRPLHVSNHPFQQDFLLLGFNSSSFPLSLGPRVETVPPLLLLLGYYRSIVVALYPISIFAGDLM